jgi:hypothetical protein
MAFLPHTIDGSSRAQQTEYLPASNITPKKGLLLRFNAGLLVLCSGTNKPEYICLKEGPQLSSGDVIPVQRILPDTIYETTLYNDGDSSGPKLGTKQTIHTDGLQVTKTTTSGVAEVVGLEATDSNGYGAAGDRVLVRFA